MKLTSVVMLAPPFTLYVGVPQQPIHLNAWLTSVVDVSQQMSSTYDLDVWGTSLVLLEAQESTQVDLTSWLSDPAADAGQMSGEPQ